jgi:hypothetical protein
MRRSNAILFVVISIAVPVLCYLMIMTIPLPSDSSNRLPSYEASSVRMLCDTFRVSESDPFCAEPNMQNAGTLRMMLNRLFRFGSIRRIQFMSFVELVSEFPNRAGVLEANKPLGYCSPAPEITEHDFCHIFFPNDIGYMYFRYDDTTDEILLWGEVRFDD